MKGDVAMKPFVLVTGGSGFIGSNLITGLLRSGRSVISILPPWEKLNLSLFYEVKMAVNSTELNNLPIAIYDECCLFVRGDITDESFVHSFFATIYEHGFFIDNTVHLAACSTIQSAAKNEELAWKTNLGGTKLILDAVKEYAIKTLIYTSTDKVYGEGSSVPYDENDAIAPVFVYDKTKAAAEILVKSYYNSYNLPAIILRFCNVYGPGDLHKQRIVPCTLRNLLFRGASPVLKMYADKDGSLLDFKRDFIYIDDIVEAILSLLLQCGTADNSDKSRLFGEAFNLGTENCYSISEIIRIIQKLTGDDKQYTVEIISDELREQCMSFQKANKTWGFIPKTSLAEGLQKTVSWFKRRDIDYEWLE